jgi:hypothetical protein
VTWGVGERLISASTSASESASIDSILVAPASMYRLPALMSLVQEEQGTKSITTYTRVHAAQYAFTRDQQAL